jgi:hypothetical protein
MNLPIRFAATTLGLAAGFFLGKVVDMSRMQDARPADSPAKPAAASSIFLHAVEYRTPTKSEVPLPSGTENPVIYQVPAGTRIVIKSYILPLGVPANGGKLIAPLGLGLQLKDEQAAPRTVHVNNEWEQIVQIDPGVEFTSGQKIVVRFGETVKGLSGALFLNGTQE